MRLEARLRRLEAARRRRRGAVPRPHKRGALHGADRTCIDVIGVADGTQQPPAWWTRDEAQEALRILQTVGALE